MIIENTWNSKFCHISELVLKTLSIPVNGIVLQMGTAYGCSLEKLCSIYGKERVVGWDIENPLNHPNVSIVDCNESLPKLDLALVHVDTGSVHQLETHGLRIKNLKWAAEHVVPGGYLFTIAYSDYVLDRLKFDVATYLESQHFECAPVSTLVDPVFVEFCKEHYNFDLAMEVIAKKSN